MELDETLAALADSTRREAIERLWLDEVETYWTRDLAAFNSHVERKRRRPRRG